MARIGTGRRRRTASRPAATPPPASTPETHTATTTILVDTWTPLSSHGGPAECKSRRGGIQLERSSPAATMIAKLVMIPAAEQKPSVRLARSAGLIPASADRGRIVFE